MQAVAKVSCDFHEVVGDDLLQQISLPYMQWVSSNRNHVTQLKWGMQHKFKLALVGKGVCFDTGGLNIKPGSGMKDMKRYGWCSSCFRVNKTYYGA